MNEVFNFNRLNNNAMKKIAFIILFMITKFQLFAQYQSVFVEKANSTNFKIAQIDYLDNSTIVFLEYTNNNSVSLRFDRNAYIIDLKTGIKYKLINAINIPSPPNVEFFDLPNQKHNFCLEFEKIPSQIERFNLIENDTVDNSLKLYNVSIDYSTKLTGFMDVDKFIAMTPMKERGRFFKDDNLVIYYKYKGVFISLFLTIDKHYGKYYSANLFIENNSGNNLDFDPSMIYAFFKKDDDKFDAEILGISEYQKKVNRKLNWQTFAYSYGEYSSARQAGYSKTLSSSSGHSNSAYSANGYYGGAYGSLSGNVSSTSNTQTVSTTYNGAAGYAARQNAINNVEQLVQRQNKIKESVYQNYSKRNTISSNTQYTSYFKIKFEKADRVEINIPFYNTEFLFKF
jgi:hypothetical protein